ncbi:hypothetical protein TTHERM_00277410 (macronuclear) [Tetrahymena thermophila SB210]|uniref:Kinase domain protein n=1 Tax=Tetrahymena thermophila (strain SB210) TaxID=312017 RepID=I7M8D2_TETTS|nr:hypothetical protein TTHERM_00277410 [Tetrahymena thermophila SB210]EAR97856.2 hypothetical protein TTHERM_00277410 [Tetrahymena thermophila SB210]|eukprot:XP_001018101.2 hypothetical protein TTHERM_00277410 [Tetrahymena thermophila SB210]
MDLKMQDQIQYLSEDSIFLKSEILDLLNQIQKIRQDLSEFEFYDNQIYQINFIAKNSKTNQNSMLSIFQKYRLNQKNQLKLGNRIKGQNYIMTFCIDQCFEIDKFLIQETEYTEYLRRNKIYSLEEINQYTKDIIRVLVINKSDCKIRDQKVLAIASTIGQCKNLNTLKIDLGLNEIGCDGAGQFLQNLSGCKNLNKLFLSFSFGKSKYPPWSKQISLEGAEGLGQGFEQLTSIQCLTIDLDKQPLGKGCAALFRGISKCQNLINLNFSLKYYKIFLKGNILMNQFQSLQHRQQWSFRVRQPNQQVHEFILIMSKIKDQSYFNRRKCEFGKKCEVKLKSFPCLSRVDNIIQLRHFQKICNEFIEKKQADSSLQDFNLIEIRKQTFKQKYVKLNKPIYFCFFKEFQYQNNNLFQYLVLILSYKLNSLSNIFFRVHIKLIFVKIPKNFLLYLYQKVSKNKQINIFDFKNNGQTNFQINIKFHFKMFNQSQNLYSFYSNLNELLRQFF